MAKVSPVRILREAQRLLLIRPEVEDEELDESLGNNHEELETLIRWFEKNNINMIEEHNK